MTLARTGLRLGEAVALLWEDVDLPAAEIFVRRTFSGGAIGTPKSGRTRRVDMGTELVTALRHLDSQRKAEALAEGREASPLVFPGRDGQHLAYSGDRER